METELATDDGQTKQVAVKVNTFELGGREVIQRIFRDVTGCKMN
jgi:hypothetical protein